MDPSSCTYAVEVDFWENQRYRPLQGGWTRPFSGGLPNYSCQSGKNQVADNIFRNDSFYLPIGWRWTDESWKIDISGSHGQCDEEGWSYATTFDMLILQSHRKELKAERSTAYTARRRRWTRWRLCFDTEVIEHEKSRRTNAQLMTRRMMNVMDTFNVAREKLLVHHLNWMRSIQSVTSPASEVCLEVQHRLEFVAARLKRLKEYLGDLGVVESNYAASLQAISLKWRRSALLDIDERVLTYSVYKSSAERGFFDVLASTHEATASRKNNLAQLLCTHLPAGECW
jgi:hypothetical protein